LSLAGCNNNGASPAKFTIGGSVVNLAGTAGGLVLQNNLQSNLTVNANGSFTFATPVASGAPYSITIATQPSNPAQTCGVTNGSGTATANITNIQINCGHNEWAWVNGPSTVGGTAVYGTIGVPSANNNPGPRQTPATWTDSSGNFWLFGGYLLTPQTYVLTNDLWKFSSGQWTWMGGSSSGNQAGTYGALGVPAMSNVPGGRYYAATWTDTLGNLWLFGGTGLDSAGNDGSLNDLWKYSAGEWTWMGGSDLEGQPATYGTLGIAATANIPSARFGSVTWTDSSGDFWLFGGFRRAANLMNGSMLNDLWKYSNGEWTWESGSQMRDQPGVYGTQGLPAPGNIPGARFWAVGWTDSSGGLWLFGGTGYAVTSNGFLNDLWKYSNGQWTWISGSPQVNQPGSYGVQGNPASGNTPGSRQEAISWTDPSGTFWLFGGNGMDSAAGTGLLNDMWKYSNGKWTWMSGSKLINQAGVYGMQSMLFPGNIPGARTEMASWLDANGNLWLFGGYGVYTSNSESDLSDLWTYTP
ncbi:MAG: hypothetical protein WBY66_04350, partial [Candidatus Acidiferrales bacterium]